MINTFITVTITAALKKTAFLIITLTEISIFLAPKIKLFHFQHSFQNSQ